MNIGIVTTWFERGAAYVSRQYRNVLTGRHNVYVYARDGEKYAVGDPVWDGGSVTWGKKTYVRIKTSVHLGDFKRWLLGNNIELVLFNEQHWWPPVLLCNDLGIITGAYVDFYTEATVPFFDCYDFLICNSKRHYGVFNWHPNCLYLPWGTDTEVFKPRNSGPVNEGRVTFFHSAGMNPKRKGTDYILRAFDNLSDDAALVIHSQQPLRIFFPELVPIINRLESSGVLTIHEKTVPAPGLYHLGDVYLYPSVLDGMALTIAEALSCGLPVVTTDHPPMNEFIKSGRGGRLISVEYLYSRVDGYYWPQCKINVDNLRDQIRFFMTNYENLEVFKRNARRLALEERDWHKNAAGLAGWLACLKKRPFEEINARRNVIEDFERSRQSLEHRYPLAYFFINKVFGQSKTFKKIFAYKI
jgi:1,2-diacylglycerol 3-alpha-glucosyltransferase